MYIRVELATGALAIILGVPGYLLGFEVLEFFAVLAGLATFVLVFARALLDPPRPPHGS